MVNKRLFDDVARVAGGAAGAFGGLRSRMEGELRDQAERFLSRMNLVTREEYEVVAALAQKARAEQEILAERVAVLEAKLSPPQPSTQKPKPAPSAKVAPKPRRLKS